MILPATAQSNPETLSSNAFQNPTTPPDALSLIQEEFRNAAKALMDHGIGVQAIYDLETPSTPDAIFPNNWFSTTPDGRHYLYPMLAPNRREERKPKPCAFLNTYYPEQKDLTHLESKNLFLEGTGSMVLDHINQRAYAAISPRTSIEALKVWCSLSGYQPIPFETKDSSGIPIYHTNVMMSVGSSWAAIVPQAIPSIEQRRFVNSSLAFGREVITLDIDQMNSFCANIIELRGENDQPHIILSTRAYDALTSGQKASFKRHGKLVPISVPTIETIGGGGIRCMIAELF